MADRLGVTERTRDELLETLFGVLGDPSAEQRDRVYTEACQLACRLAKQAEGAVALVRELAELLVAGEFEAGDDEAQVYEALQRADRFLGLPGGRVTRVDALAREEPQPVICYRCGADLSAVMRYASRQDRHPNG